MTTTLVQESAESLEARLNRKDEVTRQMFIEELLKPKISPRDVIVNDRYLKKGLAPYIVSRLESDGVNFESVGGADTFQDVLYGSVNKEPMKRSYWGQFNANAPREIMQELPPWAAFYFYAGVWGRKSTPQPHRRFFRNNLRNQTIYRIVYDCVMEGIRVIRRIHNRLYEEGKYKHPFRAPHENEVTAMMEKPIAKNPAQYALPFPA